MKTNKFLGFLFAVLLVVFFANTANALVVIDNDHVRVTKGDSYWKIAKAMRGVGHIWPKIQKENGYAPNKLPIGAIIAIPAVGVIDITNINSAPDGDRAKCEKNSAKVKQRVREALFLSDEVKKGLVSSIENNEPTMTSIKNGETVSHMSSKRGIHYNPEGYRYAIKDAKKLPAYSWTYETDKSFFEVRCIKACGNTDIRETPKPVKVAEEIPVKEEIPVEVIKEVVMIIPPPDVEEEKIVVKEVVTPEIIPTPPKEEVVEKKSFWDLETKDTIYAGAYDSVEKYDHHSRYWGNEFAAYLFKWNKYRFGYSNKYTGWDGGSNDSKWSGEKIFHGIEILREDGNDETKARLRFGRTRGKSSGADGNYISSYTVPMFNVYLGHIQRTDQPKDKWFNEFKYTLSADIDMGKGRQEAYWKGKLIPNAPYKYQAEYSAYVQTDVYQGRFDYTFGVKGDYSRRDNLYAIEPRIGVEFWNDKAEATIGYRIKEGSGNNSIGANVSLNVDSVTETIIEKPIEWGIKTISGFFKGGKK